MPLPFSRTPHELIYSTWRLSTVYPFCAPATTSTAAIQAGIDSRVIDPSNDRVRTMVTILSAGFTIALASVAVRAIRRCPIFGGLAHIAANRESQSPTARSASSWSRPHALEYPCDDVHVEPHPCITQQAHGLPPTIRGMSVSEPRPSTHVSPRIVNIESEGADETKKNTPSTRPSALRN